MYFHQHRRKFNPPVIILNDVQIEAVDSFNYLGVVLDKHLSWKPHISSISAKLGKITGVIGRLKYFLPAYTLQTIYNSLMLPALQYGILSWDSHSNVVFKFQKRAVRYIVSAKYNAHTDPIFHRLNILKVTDIKTFAELSFYFKFCHGDLPLYFHNNFITYQESFSTRRQGSLQIPRFQHEYFRSSLRYSIVKTINESEDGVISKIDTHSAKGFLGYCKTTFISKYPTRCEIPNCYICAR